MYLTDNRLDIHHTDADASIAQVRQVHGQYKQLQRDGAEVEALVVRRLALIVWRDALLRQYVRQAPDWTHSERFSFLRELGIYISPELRAHIQRTLSEELFAQLMAHQGVRTTGYTDLDLLAGPDRYLTIDVNKNSRWPFARWSRDQQFTAHAYEQDKVRYRGIEFLPGDVLLTNTNRDGNGIYTSLAVPRGHLPHSGFFAILERQGRRYPCVMETYEFGVRAVPLSTFLHPRFASYIEVYRHHDATAQHAAVINACAQSLMDNTKGYSFDTEDPNRDYVSCTTIGRFMFEDARLTPLTQRSHCTEEIKKNLALLGFAPGAMMFPIDYLRDRHMRCVGWIDNHHTTRLLARWFVEREFARQLSEFRLLPAKLPLHGTVNFWAIRQVRQQSMLAWPLEKISGFDQFSLPKGPDQVIAHITVVEKKLGKQVRAVDGFLQQYLSQGNSHDTRPGIEDLLYNDAIVKRTRQLVHYVWLQQRNQY